MSVEWAVLILHFDGGCEKNPGGPMSYGWHLDTPDGKRVADQGGSIYGYPPAESTNNTAELEAMLAGIEWVNTLRLGVGRLIVRGDSRLAIKAASQRKIKKPHLKAIAERIWDEMKLFGGKIVFEWVPRERNKSADKLAHR